MGGNDQSYHLSAALSGNPDFAARGFAAECGATGGVVISRGGHARGVWHFAGGVYLWTPAGYSEGINRVDTVRAAVEFTLNVVTAA